MFMYQNSSTPNINSVKMQGNKETWQESTGAMAHLLKTGHLSDVDIRVGTNKAHQEVFKCHKLVLASGSPVFEAMFYGNFMEKTQKEITISDIEPEDFQVFLEYIYTGCQVADHNKFSLESMKNFIYIGHKYLRPKFTKYAYDILEKAVPKLRFLDFVELFDFSKKMGYQKINLCISQELQKTTYKTSDLNHAIIDLDFETFKEFLKCINGEFVRFVWIEEYVLKNKLFEPMKSSEVSEELENGASTGNKSSTESETKNQLGQLTDERKNEQEMSASQSEPRIPVIQNWKMLLSTINYNNMTIEQLRDGPAKSNLLTSNEKFDLVINRCQFFESQNCVRCHNKWRY